MKKSILAIVLAVMLVFGFTASSYACWGMNCSEAEATAGLGGVGGDQYGPNQGYGYYEGGSGSSTEMCGFGSVSFAGADADGFGTGDGYSFMGQGKSYGIGAVKSEAGAGSVGFGYGNSTAEVGGMAGQYNQTDVHTYNGYGSAGGRNETWASYEGADYNYGAGLTGAAIEGGAAGLGGTQAFTYSTGNHTVAGAATLGGSGAYQTGCGNTNASGYGEVYQNTYAQSNTYGNSASAGTSGYAAGTYNNNGGNVATGAVGAATYGESNTYTGPNFSAASASSSSVSFSK